MGYLSVVNRGSASFCFKKGRFPASQYLINAVHGHDAEPVALLLHCGCDPNRANKAGLSPLMAACQKGHLYHAKMLAAHGADSDALDSHGFSPAMHAALNG